MSVSSDPAVTVARLAQIKRLPVQFLESLGIWDLRTGVAISYGNGNRVRIRTSVSASGSRWEPRSRPIVPYGLFRDQTTLARGRRYLIIAEGESDAWTAWYHGYPALGIPGASMVNVLTIQHVAGVERLLAVAEPDEAGQRFPTAVANRIEAMRDAAASLGLTCPTVWKVSIPDVKDPSDLHLSVDGDHDSFVAALETAIGSAEEVQADSANTADSANEDWPQPIPFTDFDPPPFPSHVLPSWLRDFVLGVARATQTPTDLAAMLGLAAMAVAVARKAEIEIKPGWREPLNLYVTVVMHSGSRKSAVFREVVAPIEAEEARAAALAAFDIASALTDKELLEDRRKDVKKKIRSGEATDDQLRDINAELEALVVPSSPRLLADDVTAEKLELLLAEHDGRMGIFAAEGDIFDIMAGRYNQGATNIGVFLKAHPGDTVRVDRIGRGTVLVEHPALTIGLAVQPGVIDGLAAKREFRGRGLTPRFLYALPASNIGRRDIDPAPLPQQTRNTYQAQLGALLSMVSSHDTNYRPRVLHLADDARQSLLDFAAEIEPELTAGASLADITDWASKLVGATARIAALLHLGDNPILNPSNLVEKATVDRAIEVARYLIPHAEAAFSLMGADPAVADARYMLDVIIKRGWTEFSQRDLFEAAKGRMKKVAYLKPGLLLLVDHDYLREQDPPPRSGPGRPPSPRFSVNPHIHSHNPQNPHNQPKGT